MAPRRVSCQEPFDAPTTAGWTEPVLTKSTARDCPPTQATHWGTVIQGGQSCDQCTKLHVFSGGCWRPRSDGKMGGHANFGATFDFWGHPCSQLTPDAARSIHRERIKSRLWTLFVSSSGFAGPLVSVGILGTACNRCHVDQRSLEERHTRV